jgi:hypothetical protein
MPKQEVTIDWIIDNYIDFFKDYGIDEKFIRSGYEGYLAGKPEILPRDFLWAIFNHLLMQCAEQCKTKEQLYRHQRDIYSQMLGFERRHENKKAHQMVKTYIMSDINYNLAISDSPLMVEVIGGHCCPYCDKLSGKTYSIPEIKKSFPIANSKCTNPYGCNCGIAVIPDDDPL